jgi:glycosyltransferase involved in cell wall biosynthesis
VKKLRVVLVVQGLDGTGGMERSTRALARGLAARGARVTVLTSVSVPGRRFGPVRTERGNPAVVRFPWPAERHYTLAELAFYARAARWLFDHPGRWDVVHGVYLPTCGALAALVGVLTGRPSVLRLACSGPPGDVATVARHPARRAIEWLLGQATVVACPGTEIADEVRAVSPGANAVYAPNGVDPEVYAPGPEPREPATVLAVMRLRPEKAVPRLLDAWAQVEAAHASAVLELVGDGPERERIHQHARALGLARVRFLGLRDDVPRLLRRATVYVHASEAEGMSNALLEAMASGCACVATDLAPNKDALDEAGLLVARTPAAIAEGLLALLRDPARRDALGRAARARAAGPLSLDSMVARYEALYRVARMPRS